MNVEDLARFPERVAALIDGVPANGRSGEWGIVENVCHLRDIESEGYAVRIEQLLREDDPLLHDLDGDRLAVERRYAEQDARDALRRFAEARARSVSLLRDADERALAREGTFENVGRVTLAKLVSMMREHDTGHFHDLALLAALQQPLAPFRADLEELCRIPGISASDPKEVRRSAEATARLLEKHGIGGVRLLEIENAHPAVYGSIDVGPDAPTLLIYGHHDVQPVGALTRWDTPPFEPVERDGRLYGRGTADDKGGVLAHVAAAASYRGALPCNLKFFIEGEEEIGSPNLGAFLERYGDLLRADAVVLADTPNADTGVPGLTRSLRGLCVVDVEVRCLERPLHSGRGGGAAPDAIAMLCQVIASLSPTPQIVQDEHLHRDLGLLDGVSLIGTREQTWNEPSITVIGFDAPPVEQSFNQLAASARARLSIRTVPAAPNVADEIVARLRSHANVSVHVVKRVPWWTTDAIGPVFDAARRALTRGYGVDAQMIGSGGTIGFVGTFASAFAGTPLLLMGVEDPPCNAHSENESLHLGDWASCVRASIYLYDELRRAL
ncbi:MAG TPA: M20/M25/M40 family metallo-hydrolase [Thermoanaerobaculia bacterium]|nr:M20/M25/M40 family metallo-hydrolase [Thermoanaerobaculia bacterium]